MSLLISTVPYAQEEIIKGFCRIMTTHSEHSRQAFQRRLQFLADTPPDLLVVLSSYVERGGAPEFGLVWHRVTDQHQYPLVKNQEPYMIGGLVFHAHSDNWGVHT